LGNVISIFSHNSLTVNLKMRKIFPSIVLCVLLLSLIQPMIPVGAAVRTLKIVSPHPENIRQEFETAFKNWYNSTYKEVIAVQWLDYGGTSGDLTAVESQFEKSPTGIDIDLFYGGGVDPFIKLVQDGYLAPYKLPDNILKAVPKEFAGLPVYDDQYRWYGAALSGFGIMYNKPVLQRLGFPEPKTWTDIATPAAKGWVGSADPRTSGSTHMAYELMLQGYGWEKGWQYISMIGANTKAYPTSSTDIPKAVANGDVAYGLAIDYYAWEQIARIGADKIGYALPDGLTQVNPDSIAILKGAPQMDLAQKFVEFVMSEPGQSLWMLPPGASGGPKNSPLGRMCVLPDLYAKLGSKTIVPVNPFNMKNMLKYDTATGSAHYSVINDLFGAMIIDKHDALVGAWDKITETSKVAGVDATKIDAAKARMGASPITQKEADTLGGQWRDQVVRNQKITEWRGFADTKYSDTTTMAQKAVSDAQAAAAAAVAAAAAAAAQQAQLTYAISGLAVVALVAVCAYVFMRRRKEVEAVKK